MRECERNLVRAILESPDPTKTTAIAEDILRRLIVGEEIQSIAASYGIKLEEVVSA